MNKVTKMALGWLSDGLTEAKAVENVKDELVYDILEQYELELDDSQMAKLERVIRVAVDSNINWEEIEDICNESDAYLDAKRSAVYGR
jgi:uncharacterized protein YpuA (DUF1002 family)